MTSTYRVKDLLIPEAVLIKQRPLTDIQELFQIIGDLAATVYCRTDMSSKHALSARQLSKALQKRADQYPIGTGGGILLPHGNVRSLDRFVAVFVKWTSRQQIEKIPDGAPIDLIFAMFGPQDSKRSDLKLLVYMAQIFSDHDLRNELRDSENSDQLYRILTSNDLPVSNVPKPSA